MHRRLVTLFAACCALLMTLPATADDDKATAREIFRAAESAFGRGEYRAAALAFEAAEARSPSGGAAYNAAIAWERAAEPGRAADALERALRSGELVNARLADANQRLAALEPALAVLVIDGPPSAFVSVGPLKDAAAPRRLHLAPREHSVRVRWQDGRRETFTVQLSPGKNQTLTLGVPRSSKRRSSGGRHETASRPTAPEASSGFGVPWGWMLVSAGTLSATTGAILLGQGLSARDDFEGSGRTDAGARDRALSYRTWSTAALIGGGALIGSGTLVLALSSRRSDPPTGSLRWSLDVAPTGARLVGQGW